VVATANDISQLPPELLRKGRFDEIFFVDLPSANEREQIWRIPLASGYKSNNINWLCESRVCG
jgi:SpoVK/Ycf46/Vps4 family AAA+-type ATPase